MSQLALVHLLILQIKEKKKKRKTIFKNKIKEKKKKNNNDLAIVASHDRLGDTRHLLRLANGLTGNQ